MQKALLLYFCKIAVRSLNILLSEDRIYRRHAWLAIQLHLSSSCSRTLAGPKSKSKSQAC